MAISTSRKLAHTMWSLFILTWLCLVMCWLFSIHFNEEKVFLFVCFYKKKEMYFSIETFWCDFRMSCPRDSIKIVSHHDTGRNFTWSCETMSFCCFFVFLKFVREICKRLIWLICFQLEKSWGTPSLIFVKTMMRFKKIQNPIFVSVYWKPSLISFYLLTALWVYFHRVGKESIQNLHAFVQNDFQKN